MLYDTGHSEIRALSIHFHFKKLISLKFISVCTSTVKLATQTEIISFMNLGCTRNRIIEINKKHCEGN